MKRFYLAMTLLGLILILGGSASAQTTPIFEHYLCYYVPNQPVQPIPLRLQDQFEAPTGAFESTTQVQLMRLCNPAIKILGGVTYPIGNTNHHLTMYQLNPQPIIPRQVVLKNQFFPNGTTIYTSDARVLMVPTGKALPPTSPPSASPDLDHYKCYVASGPNAFVFPFLTDQFNNNLHLWVVQPVLFCNPVIKINAGVTTPIQFPSNHLTCYALVPPGLPVRTANIANQFIPSLSGLNITVNNPDMLCAPTTKVSWSVVVPPPPPTSSLPALGGTSSASAGKR